MIESVTSKAEQLHQQGISPEIHSRYQNLIENAKVSSKLQQIFDNIYLKNYYIYL